MARQKMGRRKIEMKKISNESNLQVTFSKRRSGIFKKASELSTLCGAEVAIMCFSPGGKVFSFGNPSVEEVFNRFLNENTSHPPSRVMELIQAHRNANINELNMELTEALEQLEIEKARGQELENKARARSEENWWERPIEDLNESQLLQLRTSLMALKKEILNRIENIQIHISNSQQVPNGSSSNANAAMMDHPFVGHCGF